MPPSKPSRPQPISSPQLVQAAPDFHSALHSWYRKNHRKLPWREKPSLYRTVVSELMLQQTRIDTALPYFERWMRELPDFAALSAASEDQVLKLWEGLGYYRRARFLHRLAKEIVELDEIPRSAEKWLEFPGIGPYSAAAVTSISFGTPAACVDGNVVRVLARLTGCETPFKDAGTAVRLFRPLAQKLIHRENPGLHNQAMMELGATICLPNPDCVRCPVTRFCEARKAGQPGNIPQFAARRMEKREVVRLWVQRGNKILLSRAASDARRLADLCELPTAESAGICAEEVSRSGNLRFQGKRTITRYSITELIFEIPAEQVSFQNSALFWADADTISELTLSGPHRRWIEEQMANEHAGR